MLVGDQKIAYNAASSENEVVFQVFALEACQCHKQIIKKLMPCAKSAIKEK